jgi:hypothetical protein
VRYQLQKFNSYKRPKENSMHTRHVKDQETPLALYLGIAIQGKTRSKEIIDQLVKLGISVSCDCVLSVSTDLANSAIEHFEQDGVVCPSSLRSGLITLGAVDNFDHNPGATSATGATHGTSLSLFQEVTEDRPGVLLSQARLVPNKNSSSSIKALPEYYSIVLAAAMVSKDPAVPQSHGRAQGDGQHVLESMGEEYR